MSRNQPVGIKKLTNICIVRLKRNGKRFEVAAYRNTVISWRNQVEKDIDEVLQVHTIFANLDKGVLAKSEDMLDAFGTDDEDKVCVEILNKGEFQVSEEERQMMITALFRDVASRVTDMCVNPETQRPYPLTTIERAMRETLHFVPATNRSAKMQSLQVIRQLEAANVLPIVRAKMQLRLLVPHTQLEAFQNAIATLAKENADRLQTSAADTASDAAVVSVGCLADPGLFRQLSELSREHGGSVQVLELKASADDATAAAAAAPPQPSSRSAAAAPAAIEAAGPPPPLPAAPPPTPPSAATGANAPPSSRGASVRGGGVPSDRPKPSREERMFKLNLRNAEKGDPVAQLEVGKAYVDGLGVEADVQQGRMWLEQAKQQGVNAAVTRLEALSL
mmetsp:Transcript_5399/g.14226  ORF Transcript_5399/g.14226 Transcript_5399/m.14226 type:complete len:392 (-) Transcript_5399:103-1278(-)